MASPGRGLLAMDESNATCGKRLDSIGLENNETNRRAYREMLVSAQVIDEEQSLCAMCERVCLTRLCSIAFQFSGLLIVVPDC
jgi:fructose-bisphosphate aldolase class 1